MLNSGGLKPILKTAFFGLTAFFIYFLPVHAFAQEVPEITGTSTEALMGPGVNIESAPNSQSAPIPAGTVERSRYGTYERALVKAVNQINSQTANGANLQYNYTITILSGNFKGQTYTIKSSPSDKIAPNSGELIMVFLQPSGNNQPRIFLETYDRKNLYIFSLLILSILLLIFFGLRGLLIGTAAILILWLGIYTTIPLYLRGWPLVIIIALTATLLSSISSFLQFGWNRKIITTVLSTVSATILTAIIAQIMAGAMHLSISLDAVSKNFFLDNPTINPANILLIGLILACFAIIQDIASSISCGIAELRRIKASAGWKRLFTTGMNIGRAHAETMITVLILAWVGASIYIFIYRYQLHDSWLHFFNQNPVASAFLLAIAGTMGIILSVPIASLISAAAWTRITPPDTEIDQDAPSWSSITNNQ
ncbi:hypothetical protein GF391_00255 [Candidatus Uhrbacteria bacterium]|nr:hypothetical protein [Candidatus Uhrbacteria bacterium]